MKQRCSRYVYVYGFILFLVFPLVVYPLVKNKLDHTNYENRELTSIKTVMDSKWKDFFPNLQLFVDDNLPYKNESVLLNKQVDIKFFHEVVDENVLLGKDNWLFYKKDNCIQDYRGSYTLTEEELEKYRLAAESLKNMMDEKGIRFCIMITPNKEEIYGDQYLPNKIKVEDEKSRADQIVKYLEENTEIPIVYPKETLCQYRDQGFQVWKKYDTHWNVLGGFIASQELLSQLNKECILLEDLEIVEAGFCGGDLANMIGMGNRFNDDINYMVNGYLDVYTELIESIPQPNLNYAKFKSDAEGNEKIMCIGDSFLAHLEPFVAANYREAVFVHRDNYKNFEEDLISKEDPDVVVFQMAERFVVGLDKSMLKLGQLESK